MRIEQPRCERANNIAPNLKRLMDRRWLMNRAGNRLEILGVECERIHEPIPADHVEWMMGHCYLGPSRAVLHQNLAVLISVDREHFGGAMQIALGIRRTHFYLTLFVQIPLRNPNRP